MKGNKEDEIKKYIAELSRRNATLEKKVFSAYCSYYSLLGYSSELIEPLKDFDPFFYNKILSTLPQEFPELVKDLQELFHNVEYLAYYEGNGIVDVSEIPEIDLLFIKSFDKVDTLLETIHLKRFTNHYPLLTKDEQITTQKQAQDYILKMIQDGRLFPDGKRVMKSLGDVLDYLSTVVEPITARFIHETFLRPDGKQYTLGHIQDELERINPGKTTGKIRD